MTESHCLVPTNTIGVAENKLLRNRPELLNRNLLSTAEIKGELVGELDTGSEL